MKGVARKAVLIGLGLGVATKEKAEQVAKELLKKGEANKGEVKKLATKILDESKRQQKSFGAKLEKETKKAVNLALERSEEELKKLKARLNIQKKRTKK